MSIVDRIFPSIKEYGAAVVTIERAPGSEELPEIACFDFIEYDTKTVPYSQLTSDEQTDVAADERTVVLHFPSGYVCVDVEQLVGFTTNPNSKFYECRGVHHLTNHQDDDVIGRSFIRLGLGPGGSYFSVFTKNLVEFLKSGDRIVSVVAIPDSVVERTMSEDAAKQITPDSYVSSNHCQAGSSLSLSYLAKTVISGLDNLARWPGVDLPLYEDRETDFEDEELEEEDSDFEDEEDDTEPGEISTLEGGANLPNEMYVFFADTFNEDVRRAVWGEDTDEIQFGRDFNQPIAGIKWGVNVKEVMFGRDFNQSIINVDWGNIESITFGKEFNRTLIGVNWKGVNDLSFGFEFNQPLTRVEFGNDVKNIKFGWGFNKPIIGVNWGGATFVKFVGNFDQPLDDVNWKGVTRLELPSNFTHSTDSLTASGIQFSRTDIM